jgi:hypothetical protein
LEEPHRFLEEIDAISNLNRNPLDGCGVGIDGIIAPWWIVD